MRIAQAVALLALVASSLAHLQPQLEDRSVDVLVPRQVDSIKERFRPRQRGRYLKRGDFRPPRGNWPRNNYVQAAEGFVRAQFPDAEFRTVNDHHVSSSGIGHVYFKQTLFGIDIDDANVNVNVSTIVPPHCLPKTKQALGQP